MPEYVEFRGFKGATKLPVKPVDAQTADKLSAPVIDFATLHSSDTYKRRRIAASVGNALRTRGALYAANHGIPATVQDSIKQQGKGFFGRSVEEKMLCHMAKSSSGKRGYQYLAEGRDDEPDRHDYREGFKAMLEPQPGKINDENPWPSDQPAFRQSLEMYANHVRRFVDAFLRLIALALGADEDFFEGKAGMSQGLCLLFYPPAKGSTNDGRAEHTDYSIITIIDQLSPVPVLEVCDRETGRFFLVPPVPGTLVILVGDFLERMSNDIFQSTIHRVRNHPLTERYSLVYFFDADPEASIEVADSCVDGAHPRRYDSIRAGAWQNGLYLR